MFIIFKLLILIQPILSQSQCDPTKSNCCNQSCLSCAQNQISECTSCSLNYLYLNVQYQCLKKCPQGTYLDSSTNNCYSCVSQYCSQCSSTQCLQCFDGFQKDPNDPQNCISQCSQIGQIQDDQSQCNYGCFNDQIFDIDYQSFSCQVKAQCPQIQQIPQLQNQNNIVSSLLDYTMTAITLVDVQGYVVQYSYPQLQTQIAFQLNISTYQVVDCQYQNQLELANNIVTCLLQPLNLLKFYNSNGTTILQSFLTYNNTKNTGNFIQSFQKGNDWNLILSQSSNYEIDLLSYKNSTYFMIDVSSTAQISLFQVKQYTNQDQYQFLSLNLISQSITYYQISPFQKVSVYNSSSIDSTASLVQLNSLYYWTLYTSSQINLLYFNYGQMSLNLLQTIQMTSFIYTIYLIPQSDLILIVSSETPQNNLKLNMYNFNQQSNQIQSSQIKLNGQTSNTTHIYSFGSLLIFCTTNYVASYQFSADYSQLEFIQQLQQVNPQLCASSIFNVNYINQEIHVWQTIQKNFILNTFNTKNQQKSIFIIAQNAVTSQVLSKFTVRVPNMNLLIEYPEIQMLLELKSNGLAYIHNTISKKIVNQVRIWYPISELSTQLLYNYKILPDGTYLFTGIEMKTFTIKIVNMKTLEIIYVQSFPEIIVALSQINYVLQPFYYPNSGSIVAVIQYYKQITDTQKNFLFLFFSKSIDQISANQYKLQKSLQSFATNYIQTISVEYLIIFYMTQTSYYTAYFYDLQGRKIQTSPNYKQLDLNFSGKENQQTQQALISSYYGLYFYNLTTLTYTVYPFQCAASIYFSLNFQYYYTQSACSTQQDGVFTYSNNTLISQGIQPRNKYIYIYKYNDDRYLVIATNTPNQLFYDNVRQQLFTKPSIYGANQDGMIEQDEVIFFNSQATTHYDLNTFNLIYSEILDYTITKTFLLQTQFLRYNYIITTLLNIVQVKKIKQITIQTTKSINKYQSYFIDFVSELNFVVEILPQSINIYNSLNNQLLYSVIPQETIETYLSSNDNFAIQELFTRQILYYQPSNLIVVVYYLSLICIDATTFQVLYQYKYELPNQSFKAIQFDWNRGYLISTNLDEDCILDMNTIRRTCYKDNPQYLGLPNYSFLDYQQYLFINQYTSQLIICQMISVRVFALDTLTYIKSIYDTNFYGAQYFFNPSYNYLIYIQKYNHIFMLLDLNTMQYIALSLPAPSTDYQSINYRFFFLDDKQTYIFLNSNLLYIGLYDQKTHQLINKISLSVAFFPYSDAVIDQVNKMIFFYDINNFLNQYSYSTNNLISQYQLNQTDAQAFQKRLIWDSYKQRIILSSGSTLYLINTKRNNIELYQLDTFVTQLRFFQDRNIIQYSTYYQNVLLDYDYLLNNNQATFPTQINPRFFQVNNNTFLLLNDINSQANLFINQTITSTWIRNNLNSGYIRIVENDLQKQLVYAIFDNEIAILDLSDSLINQLDQLFLRQNIIKILFENQDLVILLSQSQQVLQLQKRQKSVKVNEIIVLKQGIAQYQFANNLTTFLFTDFSGNQQNINIVNLSYDSSKSISGNIRAQIFMPSRILSIQQLSNSQVVILMNNLIKIYDYILISEIVSVGLEFNVNFGNILIDSIYKRIFLQDHMVGSLVYDFNLQKHANSFISSFSTNLYFDDNFIYSVVSHSANIYFRQDLKLLFNFRHFNSTLELKNIRYLGVGYFFLVEFINKISVYEFSPFISLPTEKAFLQINQFSIIAFSFVKIQENDNSSNEYQLYINGFTLEGMFMYRLALDIYSQQQTQSCSLNYQLQQYNYQDDTSFNQVSSYLISQQRKLKGLTINVSKYQNLYFPKLQQNVLNNIFQLIIAPKEQNIIVYIKDPLNIQQGVSFVQIKNLEMQTSPQNYQNYLQKNDIQTNLTINNVIFPDIKQVLLENITLTEASVQINNIQTLVIQKINLQHYENQTLPTTTQLNLTNISMVIITEINLISCKFNLGRPLIVLQNIEKLQINNINVINCDCSGFDQLLLINQVQNVTLENIIISQTNFIQQSSFSIQSTQLVKIKLLQLLDIQYNNQNLQLRLLQAKNANSFIQKIFYFSNNIKVDIDDIQIVGFNINSSNQFSIFDFELVEEYLSINKSFIQNVNIKNDQDGTIFTNLGVYSTYLQSIKLQQINNMRYLLLSSYQVSDVQNIQCKNLNITNLKVINSQIVQQSFFYITSDIIILDQIQFIDINVLLTDALQQLSLITLAADELILLQNSNFSSIANSLSSTILVQNSQNVNILNINYQQLSTNGTSSALKILDSQNVTILSNVVSQCQSLQDSGAIQIINCKQVTIQQNILSQIYSEKGNGGVLYVQNSQINSFNNNLFTSNTANLGSGGAIYCENSNFNVFNNNQFIKNQALQGSGGAVLLNNCDILQIQNNTFSQNLAFIGGGIRYINLQPLVIMKNGVSFLKKNNYFYKNNATSYGINIGSYPKFLNMKNKNSQTQEQNILDNVQSGYKSPIPILIRFIDEEMREVTFVNLQLFPQLSQDILEEMSIYILQAESSNIGLLGDLRQVYSLTYFAFIFDLSYSYQPSSSAILNIKSAQLLPQFQTDIQQVIQSRYNLPITVNFRKCQVGEILQQSGNYTLCYECGQGFYSIIDPYSVENSNCKRCPVGSIACQSSQIYVQNGYWRTGNLSDVIIQCQYPEFCLPEDPQSKNGCLKGHIGPTCYECDVNGEIWGTQYSKSNQECNDCVHFYSALNIILIFLIFAFILIQIYSKINNEMILIRKYIMAKYLSKLRFVSPNLQRTQTSQSSLIKILINYFQFLAIVNSLNITLPTYFTFFNLTGGDTSQITIYSIDCLLFSNKLAVPNYIVRLLWINFQPIALFIIIQLFRYIFEKNTSHSSRQAVYTNTINIYLFFQPSVVKVITQSLSCQNIGLQSYISSDLNYTCLDREHMKYIYYCVLPLGLIWIVLIPLFLFARMRNYKQKMQSVKILFRYGYLYQEYVDDKYYWDLARLIIRSAGIIAINIFNFQIIFKGMVLFGVMFLFLFLQKKLKPFILQKFNNLEQESTFLVIITIYLLFVGSLSENYIISYIVTFIIGILNFQFVLKMLQLILIQSIPEEEKDRNIFQKLIFKIKQKFPLYFQWIKISHSYNSSPFKNWKKVSQVMKTIKEELHQDEFNFKQKISPSTAGNRISLGMSQILKNHKKQINLNCKDSQESPIKSQTKEKSKFQKFDFK
ncbi:transmembrane protein, putative (macronuclear) [Tetrahymena thermophila SB210]|uniref:Transmembrane protein, putative n=1 Tax=Tetrahymena thermophila (strain SB210) TaxID=312017 RepID=W7XJD1_TETTS|nr:transmembrane protein, putative [Tetrahymena thermophila SB210]EWS75421.1 transmembrane protein, putative [Tetrahymena thermophila SB210]|eukprot:XP_012652095.1 transmembrane protein, putative [Tetrahymena thermophila SB210]